MSIHDTVDSETELDGRINQLKPFIGQMEVASVEEVS